MKKMVLVALVMVATLFTSNAKSLSSIDLGSEGECYLFYNDEELYMVLPYAGIYAQIDRDLLSYADSGFQLFSYDGKSRLFITGSINQEFKNFQSDGDNNFDSDSIGSFYNDNVVEVSSSSHFSEYIGGKKVNYSADNLFKCFVVGCKCHPYWWNYSHVPWVEGAKGQGIGESVEIAFYDPVDGLSLLNGFVDINNLKLYKENSRVKRLRISDLTNGKDYTADFEDKVYFKYVSIPQPTTRVRLTIESVYEGSKYSDTCISAIMDHKARPAAPTSSDTLPKKSFFERMIEDCTMVQQELVLDKYFNDGDLFSKM